MQIYHEYPKHLTLVQCVKDVSSSIWTTSTAGALRRNDSILIRNVPCLRVCAIMDGEKKMRSFRTNSIIEVRSTYARGKAFYILWLFVLQTSIHPASLA